MHHLIQAASHQKPLRTHDTSSWSRSILGGRGTSVRGTLVVRRRSLTRISVFTHVGVFVLDVVLALVRDFEGGGHAEEVQIAIQSAVFCDGLKCC